MNRDKKKQKCEFTKARWSQTGLCLPRCALLGPNRVFPPIARDMTRHTSPKRFLHQKNEKTRFYKSLQRASQKKVGNNNVVSWSHRTPWTRHMSSKRIFHQKNGKHVFIKETHKYAKRKTRELSEKRAVSKQVHTKHCQKNMKKTWKIANNRATISRNTLLEAPGDLRSRNLHPKSRPVASTFLVICNQNWDLVFFRFFCFLFLSNFFFFWKNGAVFLCSWEYRDDEWWERKDGRQGGKHVNPYTPPNSRSPAPATLIYK